MFIQKERLEMMKECNVATKRGVVLNGVLFHEGGPADTIVVNITGIHGNFYSNPFYYNIGDTLNTGGIDFLYAQTNSGEIHEANSKAMSMCA